MFVFKYIYFNGCYILVCVVRGYYEGMGILSCKLGILNF